MIEKSPSSEAEFWSSGNLGMQGGEKVRLLFGQVREDEQVESFLLSGLGSAKKVFVIASGGCTALSLLMVGDQEIYAIDVNPAQVYLLELKAKIFQHLSFAEGKDACCTSAENAFDLLKEDLSEPCASYWTRNHHLLADGLNNAGWVDRMLRRLLKLFYVAVHPKKQVEYFLSQSDVHKQQQLYETMWANWQWRLATRVAFSRAFLSVGFGPKAIDALPSNFESVMAGRLARAFTAFAAARNGYLWQTFLARYPSDPAALPLYLQPKSALTLKRRVDSLHYECNDALNWLREQPDRSIDFFAISNILEITASIYAQQLANEIARTASSDALVCARSIFPKRQPILRDRSHRLIYQEDKSLESRELDRSCFCNFIEVYRAT
jgi:S-adenosylmethionine-diacylglycerol 3-amino-3-carboxypropyl transferase